MQLRSPFAGAPRTKIFMDQHGNRGFAVRVRALTPWRYKIARVLAFAVMAGIACAVVAYVSSVNGDAPEWLFWAGMLAPLALHQLWLALVGWVVAKRMTITLTEDSVTVKYLLRKVRFDRRLSHKFALLPHDQTENERRELELKARKLAARGRTVAPVPVYGISFHLIFEYLGQRNDLMTIYRQDKALQILTRLMACDEALNAQSGMGEGYATRPEDEWAESPGGVAR